MSKPNKRRQAKQIARAETLRKRKATKPAARQFPVEDPYLHERAMRRALLTRGSEPFATPDEAASHLSKVLGKDLAVDELAQDLVAADPLEKAQEFAFQALAWEEDEGDHGSKVDRLVKKALGLDALCVDALTARLRYNYESEDGIEAEDFETFLEIRKFHRARLETRWGTELAKAPEIFVRPYQRFLGALLLEGPALDRTQDCLEIALESWQLGANPGMTYLSVLSWLLAGKHPQEARALVEQLTNEDDQPASEMELFLWWKCWLSFQDGDLETAQALYTQAIEVFPQSELYLFTTAETEPDLDLDPEIFDDNNAMFGPLLEAIPQDADFVAFGRQRAIVV